MWEKICKATISADAGTIKVDYRTENGTALANDVYVPVSGTLTFAPTETVKEISIPIIDDETFDQDKEFFIRLFNAVAPNPTIKVAIENPNGVVKVLDNDHGGIFEFESEVLEISETVNTTNIKVAFFQAYYWFCYCNLLTCNVARMQTYVPSK